MDREEMRFKVFMRLMSVGGESQSWAIDESKRVMEAFEKSRPDYVDPEKIQETIDAAVSEAIQKDRTRTRTILVEHLQNGIRFGSVHQDTYRLGATFRLGPEDAHRLANEIVPPLRVPEVPRG